MVARARSNEAGPGKGAAERALKEAVRDRTHSNVGTDITPHTRVKALAEG
jgi:hypothetical protein